MPETLLQEFPPIRKTAVSILQFNIGRLCNQACRHCHVDSSPKRSGPEDNASSELIDEVLALLATNHGIHTLDITGGAPELHPDFRRLVLGARALGRQVFVRHNLTVQGEPGKADLPEFFREQGVQLFCSLPCYLEDNVDQQRGNGVFEASIRALQALNAAGFGQAEDAVLNLVYNPVGPSLPPAQEGLEADYRSQLQERFGIVFNDLLTITNQPIHRFAESLHRVGGYDAYLTLLRENYNPSTLPSLMCREAVSLRWDGLLFDCDFNLVKSLAMRDASGRAMTLQDLVAPQGLEQVDGQAIAVEEHCFACTAGAGSSCGGALVV